MCQDDRAEAVARRTFLREAAGTVGLALFTARAKASAIVHPVEAGDVRFDTPVGRVRGYLARPVAAHRRPGVLIAHGNVGQPDYQKRIAEEIARAGFVALAVERFSRIPGFSMETLQEDSKGPKRFLSETFFREEQEELQGAFNYLRRSSPTNGKVGMVGFCGGGIHAVRLAIKNRRVRAVVSFYGPPMLAAQFRHPTDPIVNLIEVGSRMRVPLQMHYGTDDYAVSAEGIEQLARLVRRGTQVEVYAYERAKHGFYQRPQPSEAAAVNAARVRYLAFLRRHLG